jgi:TPR repeat protein
MKHDDAGDAFEKLNRGLALRESGDVHAANKFFLEAGEAGFAQGYYELAQHAYNHGRRDQVEHWTQRMEELARLNKDEFAHVCCYLVYEFRMGTGNSEEQEAKAKYHLQRAAELGNSTGQALLAGNYRLGTAGFAQDAGLYEYWMSKAIDQGNVDALCSYIERLIKDGHAVSPPLRSKLATAAESGQRAVDLLKQL